MEREQSVLVSEFVNPLQLGHGIPRTQKAYHYIFGPYMDQALANPPFMISGTFLGFLRASCDQQEEKGPTFCRFTVCNVTDVSIRVWIKDDLQV